MALMKVSSHQVLAVLAAVENPTNFTAGHSQAGQSTQSPGSQVGQRQLSKEFLESPEQEGPSDPWALKLRSLMSARQPLPPHSCRRGWGWSHPPHVTLSSWVGHMSPQTSALKVAMEKQCPFWLEGVRAPLPKGQVGRVQGAPQRGKEDHPKATVRRWGRCPIPGRGGQEGPPAPAGLGLPLPLCQACPALCSAGGSFHPSTEETHPSQTQEISKVSRCTV